MKRPHRKELKEASETDVKELSPHTNNLSNRSFSLANVARGPSQQSLCSHINSNLVTKILCTETKDPAVPTEILDPAWNYEIWFQEMTLKRL